MILYDIEFLLIFCFQFFLITLPLSFPIIVIYFPICLFLTPSLTSWSSFYHLFPSIYLFYSSLSLLSLSPSSLTVHSYSLAFSLPLSCSFCLTFCLLFSFHLFFLLSSFFFFFILLFLSSLFPLYSCSVFLF